MEDYRFVCRYPQKTFCGNYDCRLSKSCLVFPKCRRSLGHDIVIRKSNPVRKDYEESRKHALLYCFYNSLWGDLKEKKKAYNRKYYLEHRKSILEKQRRPVSYKLRMVQECAYECESCPYEDCQVVIYSNRKEYMDLYYRCFHEELLKKKADYRKNNRAYLSNSEKLRNYRKKGYPIRQCRLVSLSGHTEDAFEGSSGYLTFLKINGNDYFSYITNDLERSFRRRIMTREERVREDGNYLFCLDKDGGIYEFKLIVTEKKDV